MSQFSIGAYLTSIATLSIAFLVLFYNNKSATNKIFCLYSLSISEWSFFTASHALSRSERISFLLAKMMNIGVPLIPILFLHFCLTLLGYRKKYKKLLLVGYGLSAFFILINFTTPFLIPRVRPKLGHHFFMDGGLLYPSLIAYFAAYVAMGIYFLSRAYFTSSGNVRNQLKYLLWGTLLGYALGVTSFLPVYGITIFPYPFGNYGIAIYVGIAAYAIIKYRLLDINIAITRVAIFVVVYTLVLGIPFGLAAVGRLWLHGMFGDQWFWAPMILLLGLATLGPFLYLYLQGRTERLLLKEQHRYQNALKELCKTMTRIRNTDELIKLVGTTLVEAVKTSHVAIYLKDDEYKACKRKFCFPENNHTHFDELLALDHPLVKVLNQHNKLVLAEELGKKADKTGIDFSLAIPCFIEGNLLAFIVLGPKPAHQIYTQDDLTVFETLSYSMALSIENCFFWQEIEDRQRKERIQEMDTFSYSLAHEIDNPMAIILGNSELLKIIVEESGVNEGERQEVFHYLDYIFEAATRVSAMVKAIYDFGKKDSGDYYHLKLSDVVDGFMHLSMPEFKYQRIVVSVDVPEEPIIIYGNVQHLIGVLRNFARNSMHALQHVDEKKINIKVERVNADLARLTFSDTGEGIEAEKIPIVFMPFVTTKASSEGSGMGLYYVKRIIDTHKGKVRAESAGKGKGASVILELPIAQGVTAEDLEKQGEPRKSRRKF